MFKKIISVFLASILLTAPVQALAADQNQDASYPHRIPYIIAVGGAVRNLPAITAFDDTIEDLQELRTSLQHLREQRRITGTGRQELEQLDRQIGDIGASISTMRVAQEMTRISTEFSMRSTMTTIANTQLDIQLLKATLEQDEVSLNTTQLRFNAGLASESDLRAAELNLQQRESNLASLLVTLETEQQNLNRILQRPLTGYYYVVHERELIELPADLDEHIRRAVPRQPTVHRQEIARNRARAALNAEDAPFGSRERQERERTYNQAVREYNDARRSIETAIRNQHNNLISLQQRNESLTIDLQRALERHETAMINYQAGLATMLDVEAAELGILSAEIAIERNLNTFWNAQFLFENPFLATQLF